MADELKNIRAGLSSLLSGIAGLKVLDYPADSVHEFPAAVVLFEAREAIETVGNTTTGLINLVVLVSSADTQDAYDALDRFMDPRGQDSIEGALDADRTWGGNVDDGGLLSIDNVGRRNLWGGSYIAADFHIQFVKTVSV